MSTSSPKSRYAKFLEQFDIRTEHGEIRWHGNVGYVALGLETCAVARVELTDRGHQGMFNRFEVQIIHRVSGKLDSIAFEFDDYLKKEDRVDDRLKDMPDQTFHAWARDGKASLDWYIARPRGVTPITAAICEYVKMWQGAR